MRREKIYKGLCIDAACVRHIDEAFVSVFRDLAPVSINVSKEVDRNEWHLDKPHLG